MFSGISTVMPVFMRRPETPVVSDLLRAAESVLSQECRVPLELLIVDDGSPQPLQSVASLQPLFARPGVRLLRLVQNQGLQFALNAGLAHARYDLIARNDGDDYWRPGKLSRQLDAFDSDPTLTLVATSMRLVHPHAPERDRDDIRGGDWEGVLSFFERIGCPFPHGSILARKDVFHLLGGYPHDSFFSFCEDFALWGSWVRFFNVRVLPEVLFEYTISEGQITSQFQERARAASGMVHQTFLDLGNTRKLPAAIAYLGQSLDLPPLRTSAVLCAAWRFYSQILVDRELYDVARIVLPDRAVYPYDEAPYLLADRFFYLHRGPFDRSTSAHARSTHIIDDLQPLLPSQLRG